MYIVVLVAQTTKRSTHRNHIIIRMRTEDDHTLRIGSSPFRTIGIIRIRLTTRPSGDCMLNIIEDLDVHIVSRTVESQQLTQTMIAVILVRQLQDRFAGQLAQPNDGTTDQLIVPFATGH